MRTFTSTNLLPYSIHEDEYWYGKKYSIILLWSRSNPNTSYKVRYSTVPYLEGYLVMFGNVTSTVL